MLQVSGTLTAYVNCHTDHSMAVVKQTIGLTKDILLKENFTTHLITPVHGGCTDCTN